MSSSSSPQTTSPLLANAASTACSSASSNTPPYPVKALFGNWKVGKIMLLVAMDTQLYTIGVFNLLNVNNSIAPHSFSACVESPLNKASDPEELPTISSKLAA